MTSSKSKKTAESVKIARIVKQQRIAQRAAIRNILRAKKSLIAIQKLSLNKKDEEFFRIYYLRLQHQQKILKKLLEESNKNLSKLNSISKKSSQKTADSGGVHR